MGHQLFTTIDREMPASVVSSSVGSARKHAVVEAPYFLAVVAIFKNECAVLDEWLNHHASEGVAHFFLLDNNSTDRCAHVHERWAPVSTLVPFYGQARDSAFNQLVAYESIWDRVRASAEWVAIIDMDEFLFGVDTSLRAALAGLAHRYAEQTGRALAQVCAPWVPFGSNGNVLQPACVVTGCTTRATIPRSQWTLGKCLVRTQYVSRVRVHRHFLGFTSAHHDRANGSAEQYATACGDENLKTPLCVRAKALSIALGPCLCADGSNCRSRAPSSSACSSFSEAQLPHHLIRVNHYRLQSRDHLAIKAARGGVSTPARRYKPARMGFERWFQEGDTNNNVIDLALARKQLCTSSQCHSTIDLGTPLPLRVTAPLPAEGLAIADGAIVSLNLSGMVRNASLHPTIMHGGVQGGSLAAPASCRVEWLARSPPGG